MISTSVKGAAWSPPVLRANEVHIWSATLDPEPADFGHFEETLAPDERARGARFYFGKDRRRFVTRQGLLREMLGCYLGREPQELRFATGPYGKPFLLNGSEPHEVRFNLAHSSGVAFYAFARKREVGIDVERVNPDLADLGVAELVFSRRELSALRALSASLQVEGFFNCWTRKEAYVKARGNGLFMPMDSFDVSLTPGERAEVLDGDGRWLLHTLGFVPGFAAAVAVEGAGCNLGLGTWGHDWAELHGGSPD